MKQIDQVLKGVVINGFKEINPQLATFKMLVTGAVLNNRNGSKWHFSQPSIISIHVRDISGLTPEDKYALSIKGSTVKVHVFGEPENLECKVVLVQGRTRHTLQEFVTTLEESTPTIASKVHIEGDFKDQRIRLDA